LYTIHQHVQSCSGLEERSGKLEEGENGSSWKNTAQVDIVTQVVSRLLEDESISSVSDIGVISPYRAQVRLHRVSSTHQLWMMSTL
jgi:hypothetical protein